MLISPQEEFDRKYITGTEICNRLAISKRELARKIEGGYCPRPSIRMSTGAYLWLRPDVQGFIAEHELKKQETLEKREAKRIGHFYLSD
jgi:hypothetical protein